MNISNIKTWLLPIEKLLLIKLYFYELKMFKVLDEKKKLKKKEEKIMENIYRRCIQRKRKNLSSYQF